MSDAPLIVIEGLWKQFGANVVLKGIDLVVPVGEVLAIMGSSGGGKTTLLRCISGLIRPTKGRITVDGVDVEREPEEARRRMGMVFQSAALFDFMNVADNVLFGVKRTTKLSSPERQRLVEMALDRVGLKDVQGLMPAELSGGMRKRVGIARAVALQPKLMLYDEPTTGLDPITTYTIDALIVELRAALGVTSIVVSHDVSSVFRTSDRIAFLHGGELVFQGSAKEFAASKHEAIRELIWKSEATTFETSH